MNITLVSPYTDITVFGLRTISAYLKERGHKTKLIFLPDPFGDNLVDDMPRYPDHVLDDVVSLCEGSDLIGITLMTNYFDAAVQITRKIKDKITAPVIWGGVHPTIRPEESLDYADIACIGDGEEAVLDLADRMDRGDHYLNTPNLWFSVDGRIVRNPLRTLTRDLDTYPIPDYSNEDHHIMLYDRVVPLTSELMRMFLEKGTVSASLGKIGYQTMTGRGCPHKCAYCVNDTIKNLYKGQGYLRWRSTEHVMKEFLWVREHMPYIGYMWISDDAFFGRNLRNLEEFCAEYKKKIDLPFTCLASPLTVTEEKMELLIDAGLMYLQMGIESGSGNMQKLFNREAMSNERMMKAIRIINSYKDRMFPPSYDFLLDVPYETNDDKIESLKFISEIPKPFHLQPFSLVLYPGTKLHQMARADGLISDEKKEIYAKSFTMREPSYLNLLFTLARGGRFPSALLKILVSRPVVAVLNNEMMKPCLKGFYTILKRSYKFVKALRDKA